MIKAYFLWLLKVATVLIVILVVVAISNKKGLKGALSKGENAVAVIELSGEIIDGKDVLAELHAQARNDSVAGIVLRIDSPGGAVGPSQEIYRSVATLKARKPIVASMGSVAASGGLYAALPASKVFANRGTLTGSIGVIGQFPNLKGISEKVGFTFTTVKSGALKDVGNPFREFTLEDREYLESMLSSVHQQFIDDVVSARNMSREEVLRFADGRVLTGEQAKELRLIDEFGGVHEAALAVFELLGKPLPVNEAPTLLYPEERMFGLPQLVSKGKKILSQGENLILPNLTIKTLASF
jgi:protease-4